MHIRNFTQDEPSASHAGHVMVAAGKERAASRCAQSRCRGDPWKATRQAAPARRSVSFMIGILLAATGLCLFEKETPNERRRYLAGLSPKIV
jgi:hypothetical protein